MATTLPSPPRVGMVSLGCPKALVDSERILTKLRQDGYQMSADYAGADVVLVNTLRLPRFARRKAWPRSRDHPENGRVVVPAAWAMTTTSSARASRKCLR